MDDLDNKSYKLLKKLKRHKGFLVIPSDSREIKCISKFVIAETKGADSFGQPKSTNRFKINNDGITYVLKHTASTLDKRIPYIITTLIAITALIISIIALTK